MGGIVHNFSESLNSRISMFQGRIHRRLGQICLLSKFCFVKSIEIDDNHLHSSLRIIVL